MLFCIYNQREPTDTRNHRKEYEIDLNNSVLYNFVQTQRFLFSNFSLCSSVFALLKRPLTLVYKSTE